MSDQKNVLDSALVDLAAASTALERTARPTIKDVEEAKERAKRAHTILDASHKLMSMGIYAVADAPVSPGVPLPFDGPGPIPSVPIDEAPEPSPADLLRSWFLWDEAEQNDQFLAQLGQLKELEPDADTAAYEATFEEDRTAAFQAVLFALAQAPIPTEFPSLEDVAPWVDSMTPEPEDEFTTWTPEQRQENFQFLLERLEKEGLEQGDLTVKAFVKAEKLWQKAWDADPADTFRRLRFAVYNRCPLLWGIPTDEEMATPTPEFQDPLAQGGEA